MTEETETLEQKIERLKKNIDFWREREQLAADGLEMNRNQLAAAQAELDKQKSAVWRPAVGADVWVLPVCGEIYKWAFDSDKYDRSADAQGNLFPTREAAERERDRRILIADMRRWAAEHGYRLRLAAFGLTDGVGGGITLSSVSEFAKRLHLLDD